MSNHNNELKEKFEPKEKPTAQQLSDWSKQLQLTYPSLVVRALKELPFFGNLLQTLETSFAYALPTAGVYYDSKVRRFKMVMNPYFMNSHTLGEQTAILIHELYHLCYKHTTDYTHLTDKRRANVAMDIAINQFIPGLPEHSLRYDKCFDKHGNVFPPNLSTNQYYELLEDATYEQSSCSESGEDDDSNGDKKAQQSKGKDSSNSSGNGKGERISVKELFGFDEHEFNKDGASKEEVNDALGEIFARARQNTPSWDQTQGSFKSMIEDFFSNNAKLNYRKLLDKAFKKTLPQRDRTYTWKRPNKRWGYAAPGTKVSHTPKVSIYADCSGSIGSETLNLMLHIIDGFTKEINGEIDLKLFHTELFLKQKYSKNKRLKKEDIMSGGTNLQCVTDDIVTTQPDMAIILTDGYYDKVTQQHLPTKTLFLIVDGGNIDHPLKKLGETFRINEEYHK